MIIAYVASPFHSNIESSTGIVSVTPAECKCLILSQARSNPGYYQEG